MSVGATSSTNFIQASTYRDGAHINSQLSMNNNASIIVDGRDVAIPSAALIDLNRFGKLTINGKKIYGVSRVSADQKGFFGWITHFIASINAWFNRAPSEEKIFKSIYSASEKNETEALAYAKLMHQGSANMVIIKMQNEIGGRAVSTIPSDKSVELVVNEKTFVVYYNFFIKVLDFDNPEDGEKSSYIKVQTMMFGDRQGLIKGSKGMFVTQVSHTAECPTLDEAKRASFVQK